MSSKFAIIMTFSNQFSHGLGSGSVRNGLVTPKTIHEDLAFPGDSVISAEHWAVCLLPKNSKRIPAMAIHFLQLI